ncbi:MAG: chemotaxis-specific protein-glutamate methyltransferase CheB [Lachnospiraceae bacterium]|nr:chemotaxis-specific protein-glutamate methyltransferase CheB [Lachnospiraceae bacterium]
MYNILVVDDSALMRKLMCDIINSIQDFQATDVCSDGESAYRSLTNNQYDAVTMNMMLPRVTGLEVLKRLKENGVAIPVVAISSAVKEDRVLTVEALESGAIECVLRPYRLAGPDKLSFSKELDRALHIAVGKPVMEEAAAVNPMPSVKPVNVKPVVPKPIPTQPRVEPKNVTPVMPVPNIPVKSVTPRASGRYSLIAIASSTGGPQALHTMIPMLPEHVGIPIVIVQHMPKGFTASLAERIDSKAKLTVKEAENGERLLPDTVYIAPGGRHLQIQENQGKLVARVYDDPPVNNLRPCADVMYESLKDISSDNILCVVLTGMGADGSKGIQSLRTKKKLYVITQSEDTCVVYGMPKATDLLGLSDQSAPITGIANAIVREIGG